jgi:uncharacterized cupin superfamily protein
MLFTSILMGKMRAPHFHQSIDEIIYVLKGEIWAVVGEEEELPGEGDSACFYSKSEKFHYLENHSDNITEFLIFRKSTRVIKV